MRNKEKDRAKAYRLNVKPDGWNSSHHLTKLQLVEDGGLTGGIEADHKDAHLLLAEHALPDSGESEAHGYWKGRGARTDLSEDVLASDAARCAEIKSVASRQLFVTCRYTFRY